MTKVGYSYRDSFPEPTVKTKTSRKKEYGVNKILREKIVLTINLKIIFKYTIYYFNNIISNNTLFLLL